MVRDQQHMTAQWEDFLLPTDIHGNNVNARRDNSKADKILGTADATNKRGEKKRSVRPSFLRPKRSNNNLGVPPTATGPDNSLSARQPLRMQASSPLLRQDCQPLDDSTPSLRKPGQHLQHVESSSALSSRYNPVDDAMQSPESAAPGNFDCMRNNSAGNQWRAEDGVGYGKKGSTKESKRKIRPPRIDLSLLFPKPRATSSLLSPHSQHSTKSPSQLSVNSENRSAKGNRLTKPQPASMARRPSDQNMSESSDKENNGWRERSLQRTVKTNEFDEALDKYSASNESAQVGRFSWRPRDEAGLQRNQSRQTDRTVHRVTSNNSMGAWSKETYLSPKTRFPPAPRRGSETSGVSQDTPSERRPMSKKSSKSTLKYSDLNTSSVLCLSSSDDESEEEEEPAKGNPNVGSARDSVAMSEDFESEICTASAAHATRGPTLKRVDKPAPLNSQLHSAQRNQSARRIPSTSSAGRSSYTTQSSQAHRSSAVPTATIPETPQDDQLPQPSRNQHLTPQDLRRRSRVMAVTRQEEHLLEAMRQRKGKVTPSLFREPRSHAPDPEQMSTLSAPSRKSFYGGDMSFLRLSPAFPPPPSSDFGGSSSDRHGSISQGAPSDTDQKTITSIASPRASLVYSESLPSPTTTNGASPLTPTLPIHRFSPLPMQKPPPNRPPPAVPQDQRRMSRHSRRRTDSSEAIVLDEADESKDEEFPIWAFGLPNERASVAAVH